MLLLVVLDLFLKFISPRSPPEDYFPLRGISYGEIPPKFKETTWGGGSNKLSASLFWLGLKLKPLKKPKLYFPQI